MRERWLHPDTRLALLPSVTQRFRVANLGSYAVVFSGGGALGAWEVGCLERIVAHHRGAYPAVVVGASAGAINAAGVACGMTVADLRVTWVELRNADVYAPNPRNHSWSGVFARIAAHAGTKRSIPRAIASVAARLQSVFDARPLERTLVRLMSHRWDMLTKYEGALAIAVTNLSTNSRKYYYHPDSRSEPRPTWHPITSFEVLKGALLASAAIPVVFEPRNDEVDGGVLHNQPLAAANHLAREGDPIYVLVPQADRLPTALDLAVLPGRLIEAWMSQGFVYELSQLAVANVATAARGSMPRPVCVVRAGLDLETLGSGLLKFGAAVDTIIERGRQDAGAALAKFNVTNEATWPHELRQGGEATRLHREVAEARAQKGAKSMQTLMVERFGFRVSEVESSMVITDLAGNAHVTRNWRGVTVQPGHTVSNITGEFWVGTPGGSLAGPVRLSGVGGFPKAVRLTESAFSASRRSYRVGVTGSVTSGDPPLDFTLDVYYSGAVLMSAEAVEDAYASDVFKHDYLAFDVEVPVDRLTMAVAFPDGVAVTAFPAVCYGWSEQVHDAELQRTAKGFSREASGGRFVISEPLVGFRYLIYWTFGDQAL